MKKTTVLPAELYIPPASAGRKARILALMNNLQWFRQDVVMPPAERLIRATATIQRLL
jgi:hypothetical protein